MKTKRNWVLTILAVCCVVFLSVSTSGNGSGWEQQLQLEKFGVSTLHGLTGVRLIVLYSAFATEMDRSTEIAIAGLDKSTLQTQVELELRKAGIKIVEVENVEAPLLYIEVTLAGVKDTLYYFKVRVELIEEVELIRDRKLHTFSRTWPLFDTPHVGIAGRLTLVQGIKNDVDNQIRQFCNEYLAANPKDGSKKENDKKPKDD